MKNRLPKTPLQKAKEAWDKYMFDLLFPNGIPQEVLDDIRQQLNEAEPGKIVILPDESELQ